MLASRKPKFPSARLIIEHERSGLARVCLQGATVERFGDDVIVNRVPDELAQGVPRRLVMRAEIGAEHPFWTERGTLVDDRMLPLPADLRRRVREWVDELWDLDDGTSEAETWDRKALELHQEVVVALGPTFEVTYDE